MVDNDWQFSRQNDRIGFEALGATTGFTTVPKMGILLVGSSLSTTLSYVFSNFRFVLISRNLLSLIFVGPHRNIDYSIFIPSHWLGVWTNFFTS